MLPPPLYVFCCYYYIIDEYPLLLSITLLAFCVVYE